MEKEEFKKMYIASFLGAYAADTYIYNCQIGWTNKSQPVDDSVILADEAWEQLEEVLKAG